MINSPRAWTPLSLTRSIPESMFVRCVTCLTPAKMRCVSAGRIPHLWGKPGRRSAIINGNEKASQRGRALLVAPRPRLVRLNPDNVVAGRSLFFIRKGFSGRGLWASTYRKVICGPSAAFQFAVFIPSKITDSQNHIFRFGIDAAGRIRIAV
jgi:hypothetical protein